MTDDELQAIEARACAATGGPWAHDDGEIYVVSGRAVAIVTELKSLHAIARRGESCSFADGEFIAHARADVPALTAEVRRLQALVSGLLLDSVEAERKRLPPESAEALAQACVAWLIGFENDRSGGESEP